MCWVYLCVSLLQIAFLYEIKAVSPDMPFLVIIAEGTAYDHRIRVVWVGMDL